MSSSLPLSFSTSLINTILTSTSSLLPDLAPRPTLRWWTGSCGRWVVLVQCVETSVISSSMLHLLLTVTMVSADTEWRSRWVSLSLYFFLLPSLTHTLSFCSQRIVSVLETQLSKGEYVNGDHYGLADICIFPWIHQLMVGYPFKYTEGKSYFLFLVPPLYLSNFLFNLFRWCWEDFDCQRVPHYVPVHQGWWVAQKDPWETCCPESP